MLEDWYEIWKANLVTTSNLALNRAWKARLPIIQTGDDFVTTETLSYAMDLHQFTKRRATRIACRNADLELLKMVCGEICTDLIDEECADQIIEQGNLDMIKYYEVFDLKHYRLAAKLGNKAAVQHFVESGQGYRQMVLGAAEHSADMLEYVLDLMPEHQQLHMPPVHSALCSDAFNYVAKRSILGMRLDSSPEVFENAVLGQSLEFVERMLASLKANWPSFDFSKTNAYLQCSHNAATRGLQMLQLISQYIQPDQKTMQFAAASGDGDSVLWLISRCDASLAWVGAAQHSFAMLKFVAQLGLSQAQAVFFKDLTEQPAFVFDLETVLWMERCFPTEIDYAQILYGSLLYCRPRTTRYVREKVRDLRPSHIEAALRSGNFIQLEWLIQANCPRKNFYQVLADFCDLETWKIAHKFQLYKVPQDESILSVEVRYWLEETA